MTKKGSSAQAEEQSEIVLRKQRVETTTATPKWIFINRSNFWTWQKGSARGTGRDKGGKYRGGIVRHDGHPQRFCDSEQMERKCAHLVHRERLQETEDKGEERRWRVRSQEGRRIRPCSEVPGNRAPCPRDD